MVVGLSYVIFKTRMGWMGVSGSERGLRRVILPSETAALQILGEGTVPSPHRFSDVVRRLRDYFNGLKVAFPDRLDLAAATVFQHRVWEAARLIPYGDTMSYG